MGNAKKRWSYSAGERGQNRVRVYEDAKAGTILLEFYETNAANGRRSRKRVSLCHTDRAKAVQQANETAKSFDSGLKPQAKDPKLGELFDIYGSEVTPRKSVETQRHDRMCMELFGRSLGRERRVLSLNLRDWERLILDRSEGRLAPAGSKRRSGVRNRQVEYDLKFLLAVFNWATRAGDGEGNVLLERNPFQGFPLPKERSPKRPALSAARYQAMLAVARSVDWRFELALVLAHETGHRSSAIRQLRWSDIDLEQGRIRWRADADKQRREHVTPMTETAGRALLRARRLHPGIGDTWVLPAPGDASKPVSRHLLRDWWKRAERRAGLDPIPGLGWHGLRRKFATEHMETPLKVLCALGGWQSHHTILTCYQRADEEAMRQAIERRDERLTGTV